MDGQDPNKSAGIHPVILFILSIPVELPVPPLCLCVSVVNSAGNARADLLSPSLSASRSWVSAPQPDERQS
jgi:hypothetical protein